MITVNKSKLEQVILNEISEIEKSTVFIDSAVCIGDISNIQVQLKVTRDDHEFIESNNSFICIEYLEHGKALEAQGSNGESANDEIKRLREAIKETIGFIESTNALKEQDGGESLKLLNLALSGN